MTDSAEKKRLQSLNIDDQITAFFGNGGEIQELPIRKGVYKKKTQKECVRDLKNAPFLVSKDKARS